MRSGNIEHWQVNEQLAKIHASCLSAGIVAPLYTGGALEGQLEVENALASERIFTRRLALGGSFKVSEGQ